MHLSNNFEVSSVPPQDIPTDAALTFWERSGRYTDTPRLIVPGFNRLLQICGSDNITTYVAEHPKTYHTNGATESNAYLVDVNEEETQVGFGEIRFSISDQGPFFTDKPFVGWTQTEEGYKNAGLGRRRLLAMNIAALALYEKPLHSDTLTSEAAEGLWESLVTEGLAEKYIQHLANETSTDRYRFIA